MPAAKQEVFEAQPIVISPSPGAVEEQLSLPGGLSSEALGEEYLQGSVSPLMPPEVRVLKIKLDRLERGLPRRREGLPERINQIRQEGKIGRTKRRLEETVKDIDFSLLSPGEDRTPIKIEARRKQGTTQTDSKGFPTKEVAAGVTGGLTLGAALLGAQEGNAREVAVPLIFREQKPAEVVREEQIAHPPVVEVAPAVWGERPTPGATKRPEMPVPRSTPTPAKEKPIPTATRPATPTAIELERPSPTKKATPIEPQRAPVDAKGPQVVAQKAEEGATPASTEEAGWFETEQHRGPTDTTRRNKEMGVPTPPTNPTATATPTPARPPLSEAEPKDLTQGDWEELTPKQKPPVDREAQATLQASVDEEGEPYPGFLPDCEGPAPKSTAAPVPVPTPETTKKTPEELATPESKGQVSLARPGSGVPDVPAFVPQGGDRLAMAPHQEPTPEGGPEEEPTIIPTPANLPAGGAELVAVDVGEREENVGDRLMMGGAAAVRDIYTLEIIGNFYEGEVVEVVGRNENGQYLIVEREGGSQVAAWGPEGASSAQTQIWKLEPADEVAVDEQAPADAGGEQAPAVERGEVIAESEAKLHTFIYGGTLEGGRYDGEYWSGLESNIDPRIPDGDIIPLSIEEIGKILPEEMLVSFSPEFFRQIFLDEDPEHAKWVSSVKCTISGVGFPPGWRDNLVENTYLPRFDRNDPQTWDFVFLVQLKETVMLKGRVDNGGSITTDEAETLGHQALEDGARLLADIREAQGYGERARLLRQEADLAKEIRETKNWWYIGINLSNQ